MTKTYRSYLPEQNLLLPPSLREWLPDDHLAFFVSDVVDQLNLSAIESVYEEDDRGQPPYHPRMMTKILLYGYCVGVFSSRKIQKHLVEDVAFRVLAAGNQPDFRTISDFRKLHLKALEELFQQMLRLTLETGTMKLGRVRDRFQPDQTRRATTQKNLSKVPRFGRRCRRFSTASCWRSTRFSKRRFLRLRKRLRSPPNQSKKRLNMAQSYNRLPSEPDVYVADSTVCKHFGE